jgi:hypothetical protein
MAADAAGVDAARCRIARYIAGVVTSGDATLRVRIGAPIVTAYTAQIFTACYRSTIYASGNCSVTRPAVVIRVASSDWCASRNIKSVSLIFGIKFLL